ncbi:hypothetical protein CMALT394_270022 [Carnobacterium maltaromaticum]|nr:hypothetical protein CMALT394_270022 [Carnobacterium maltaromaticum]
MMFDIWLLKTRDSLAAYNFFKRLVKQFGETRVPYHHSPMSLKKLNQKDIYFYYSSN